MKQFLIVLFFLLTFLFPKSIFAQTTTCSPTNCGACNTTNCPTSNGCTITTSASGSPICIKNTTTCSPTICELCNTTNCPTSNGCTITTSASGSPICTRDNINCSAFNCKSCDLSQCNNLSSTCTITTISGSPSCTDLNPILTPTPILPTPTPIPTCSNINCGLCGLSICANTEGCMLNTAKDACVQYIPPDPFQWFADLIKWTGDQWNAFWSWLFGCFIKSYTIPTDPSDQTKNFNEYGVASNQSEDITNINAAENRTTTYYQQFYFKGRYIMDVINNTIPDIPIAKICNNEFYPLNDPTTGCSNYSIVCLAKYFVLDTKKPTFLYADQFGTTQPLTSAITSAIDLHLSTTTAIDYIQCPIIPQPNFSHYQNVYLNFFRVPPSYSIAVKNENATRVLRTPVPDVVQSPIPINPDDSQMAREIQNQEAQLNKNFIPEGSDWSGLNSLRPYNWDN